MSYHAYDFRYPDGPHNAETLLVNDSGRLFIVTKDKEGAVYAAPRKPDRQGVNELKKVGSAPTDVTDGTFLPGGDRIALLTYTSIEVHGCRAVTRSWLAPLYRISRRPSH